MQGWPDRHSYGELAVYQAITTNRIIAAVLNNVPGTFVRDYTAGKGFLQIRRGNKEVASHDSNERYSVPAETIMTLAPGWTPRTTFVKQAVTIRPGWQVQARVAAQKLTPCQIRHIERELGFPMFRQARGL